MRAATATSATATLKDPRWVQVCKRDPKADGVFFYSVTTTGVYCRPSCPSRRPRPENVRFHRTRDHAERAGFRPCRRCRPDRPAAALEQAARVTAACRLIENSDKPPTLQELAGRAGLSARYFHHLFKSFTGLTPRGYAAANRAGRLRRLLRRSNSVTDAIYDAGYNSSSRFYESADRVLGMKPSDYRRGGSGAEIHFAAGECSLGSLVVASSARGICAILLGEDPEALVRELQDMFPRSELVGADRKFEKTIARVVACVDAPGTGLDLPLDVRGTAFQQRVWVAISRIPPGSTASYAEIARRLGTPGAARAVAQACASNRLAVAIPCHRVIRSDGSMSGYRWGVERKRSLLARESESTRTGSRRKAKRDR